MITALLMLPITVLSAALMANNRKLLDKINKKWHK
jgi:hypothetical protein